MPTTETSVSLHGFTQQDLEDIQSEANKRGCSFDEAMKQIMRERIRSMRKRTLPQALAQLLRFPGVH